MEAEVLLPPASPLPLAGPPPPLPVPGHVAPPAIAPLGSMPWRDVPSDRLYMIGLPGLKRTCPRGAGANQGSDSHDTLVIVYLLIVPVSFPLKASNLMPYSLLFPVFELTGTPVPAFLSPPKFGSTPSAFRAYSDRNLVTSSMPPFW